MQIEGTSELAWYRVDKVLTVCCQVTVCRSESVNVARTLAQWANHWNSLGVSGNSNLLREGKAI
jgi:hypothetical protein